jgi:hypothetical protein
MACSKEITAVMLYDSTIQFHVPSLCRVLSVEVTSHYYVRSRALVPRVRFDGVSYGLGDTALAFLHRWLQLYRLAVCRPRRGVLFASTPEAAVTSGLWHGTW